MYYYKLEGNFIAKYEVIFNEKALLKLKEKIIREECPVIHEELRASFFIPALMEKDFEIRNVKNEGYLFTRENSGSPDSDIYLFTYDKYLYNEDVLLINRLLNNDATALDAIFAPIGVEKSEIKMAIIQKNEEIDNISNYEIRKKQELLQELENLIEKLKKEPEQNRLKLQKLIKLNLIAKIPIENVQEVTNFWDKEINLKELNRKKILNK